MFEIKNITIDYGNDKGIFNASFCLDYGEVLGIFGENGAGKTTLLKALAGYYKETNGLMCFDGMQLKRPEEFISALLDDDFLVGHFSVFSMLSYYLAMRKADRNDNHVIALLEQYNLLQYGNAAIDDLSLGTKRRVSIMLTLEDDRQILVLDEPTIGLDEESIILLETLIKSKKADGKIIIIASHNDMFLRKVSDKTVHISKGKIVYEKN